MSAKKENNSKESKEPDYDEDKKRNRTNKK
jgi:hypothetical protein